MTDNNEVRGRAVAWRTNVGEVGDGFAYTDKPHPNDIASGIWHGLVLATDYAALLAEVDAAERIGLELQGRAQRAEVDAARFRYVITAGKLPARCTAGYYYEDGIIHATPQAAIDAAMAAEGRE